GGDHPLVDAPGHLDRDVLLNREERLQARLLLVGEQVGAGVQGPAGGVERVALAAAVTVQLLLNAAAALVQRVAGQADDVEGVHHRDRVRQLLGGGGLEAGEAVHRDDLDPPPPGLVPVAQPVLERLLRAALEHRQQPGGTSAIPDRGVRSMTTVTYLSPFLVCRQACSSTPTTRTPSRRAGSAISSRCPSARTASLAVFQDTASPSATRAMDRWPTTIPTSAHRSPVREILARGCAAAVVS